jgi:hypothetical protein
MRYQTLLTSVVLMALALCCFSRSEAAPVDSLWLRAVALSEMNDDLVPGSIRTRMQEVDKHGEPKDGEKYRESWAKLSLGEDGEVEFETVKVMDDGEDITAEWKAEEEERKAKRDDEDEESESHEMEDYNPFDPESQERMSIDRLSTGEVVDGKNTVMYEFTEHTEDDEEVRGRAWLETDTGVPVRVEYTVDPLPKRVKHMATTMEYEYVAPDSLVVKSMFIEATGGILFIKKHFHMSMTFTDYWRLPEGYED